MADFTHHPKTATTVSSSEMAQHIDRLSSAADRVVEGYNALTSPAALSVTIEPGYAMVVGYRVGDDVDGNVTKALSPSTTNYVFLSKFGTLEVNTSGVPADPDSIKLWEIVTDGTGTTGKTDFRDPTVYFQDPFKADGIVSTAGVTGLFGVFSAAEPYLEMEDTGTGDIVRLWARSNKLQVTDQAGSTVYLDDLKDIFGGSSFIDSSEKGAANGVATLDAGAVHPAAEYRTATEGAKGGVQLANVAPLDVDATTAAKGSSSRVAKQDHVHAHGDLSAGGSTHHAFDQITGIITDGQHGNRGGGALHANATTGTAGFMSATDKTKLNGIESGATADQTAADIRALGFFDVTNDGAASGLDADLLDGQHGSFYQNASNINAGTLNNARLPNTISKDNFVVGLTLNPDSDLGAAIGTGALRFTDLYAQNIHTGDFWLSDKHCSRTGLLLDQGHRLAFEVIEVRTKDGLRELRTVPYILQSPWQRLVGIVKKFLGR